MAAADLVHIAQRRLGARDSLYYAPDIPGRKAAAVRRTHAIHLPASEPLLVVYDATLLGGADEGFAITPERICWRNFFEPPRQIEFRELDPCAITVDDGALRVWGSRVFMLFGGPTARALGGFLGEAVRAVQLSRAGPYRQGIGPDTLPSSGPLTDRQLLRLARRRLGDLSWLYFAPSIPDRKRTTVRAVHDRHLPADEEVLLVYDATLFGSAQDGLAMTRNRLVYKNFLDEPAHRPWSEIDADAVTVQRVRDRHELLLGGPTAAARSGIVVASMEHGDRFATLVRDLCSRQ